MLRGFFYVRARFGRYAWQEGLEALVELLR
jgi:hypothetical protein